MRTMLPQTKRVIENLLAAGLPRSMFSVKTPCNRRGEYQPVKITFTDYPLEYVEPLRAQGFDVEILHYKGRAAVFVTEGSGELEDHILG